MLFTSYIVGNEFITGNQQYAQYVLNIYITLGNEELLRISVLKGPSYGKQY